jgi:argininosuccinate lyase
MTEELYSVEKAYELVKRGVPFREAYKIIATKLK